MGYPVTMASWDRILLTFDRDAGKLTCVQKVLAPSPDPQRHAPGCAEVPKMFPDMVAFLGAWKS